MLDLLDEKAPAFYEKFGARTIYAADEFFLTAGRPLPDASYYEGYPQLENGVGMLRCHTDEFAAALAETAAAAPGTPFTCVTGEAAYDHICALVKAAKEKIPGLVGDVAKIRNDFYGPSITVAGLLVGRDIIAQLRARGHHGRLILPSCMLRAEGDLFLDDTTLPQLSEALGAAVTVAGRPAKSCCGRCSRTNKQNKEKRGNAQWQKASWPSSAARTWGKARFSISSPASASQSWTTRPASRATASRPTSNGTAAF